MKTWVNQSLGDTWYDQVVACRWDGARTGRCDHLFCMQLKRVLEYPCTRCGRLVGAGPDGASVDVRTWQTDGKRFRHVACP